MNLVDSLKGLERRLEVVGFVAKHPVEAAAAVLQGAIVEGQLNHCLKRAGLTSGDLGSLSPEEGARLLKAVREEGLLLQGQQRLAGQVKLGVHRSGGQVLREDSDLIEIAMSPGGVEGMARGLVLGIEQVLKDMTSEEKQTLANTLRDLGLI
ncbi:hypothetical protein A2899_00290 [Candidatus Amesbacteria bacterium RIFCSPLOWO2_01_FULL_49_25]|uniref:Uncharacterized protein n=1 Tax=Candidatus Amesbacteria bacterium RIFCSPHIGHO2_01_FULL_48_32b TaxID=1797253 RepID=A0A1F4YGY7_9BACT|nr:MAG: hypothetical protein A2876_05035 [Candidatus Amesbacteria bacterium RIFCSPHIGHO2_01_FULL_48_32b]OGD07060.1 MAG: hypothetical protein A2899_00290 [Candidatus Amesbacteria bacterium RIFCSPLOWO2_01_FULL_49_25]